MLPPLVGMVEPWITIYQHFIKVPGGKFQANNRMYSEKRMEVLKREHGFDGYLDECFTAPDPIMAALVVS